MRSIASFVSVIVLAFALAGCHVEPLEVAPEVNLSRLEGRWYEIAKLPRITQATCVSTTAYYRRTSATEMELVSECRLGGPGGEARSMRANLKVEEASNPAKLAIEIAGFWGSYWILEVGRDYEYAVIGHPTRDYLWIMSRTPALEPRLLASILERMQARKFDTARLEYTPQGVEN